MTADFLVLFVLVVLGILALVNLSGKRVNPNTRKLEKG
jgi:hypothetical protein